MPHDKEDKQGTKWNWNFEDTIPETSGLASRNYCQNVDKLETFEREESMELKLETSYGFRRLLL